MKKILAVSGGIDSVVMLHVFRDDPDVVVAHFDHGIRDNSGQDAEFVRRLAEGYGREFVLGHGELGAEANEAAARTARWNFLFGLGGKVYTAHHRDDVVESVAINILRGTGWRGLAAMDERRVERPLLDMSRTDICRYAGEHGLHFREDQSNNTDTYLRNRIRERLRDLPADIIGTVAELAAKQRALAAEIDEEIESVYGDIAELDDTTIVVRRKMLGSLQPEIATEVLRKVILSTGRPSATRPQLAKLLDNIKNLQNGKRISFGRDYFIEITRDNAIFPAAD